MTRLSIRRLGVACTAALAITFTSAAPAAADEPTKLWYSIEVSYSWKNTLDIASSSFHRRHTTTTEFAWTAKTPTKGFTNEAPLVYSDDDGLSFGSGLTAFTKGKLTKSRFRSTETQRDPATQNFHRCTPESVKFDGKLKRKPAIVVLVSWTKAGLSLSPNDINPAPMQVIADKTGAVTCAVCLNPHPLRGTMPTYAGDSCTYPPVSPVRAPAPYIPRYNHGRALQDALFDGHEIVRRGRFGAKRFVRSTTSTAEVTSQTGTLFDPGIKVETAEEKISVTFTLCPGGGRRSC